MAKANRPTWFKLHDSYKHVIDAISNEYVGEGLKSAMAYFVTGEEPGEHVPPLSRVVYEMLRESADDAYSEYAAKVEGGRRGGLSKSAKAPADNEWNDDNEPPF